LLPIQNEEESAFYIFQTKNQKNNNLLYQIEFTQSTNKISVSSSTLSIFVEMLGDICFQHHCHHYFENLFSVLIFHPRVVDISIEVVRDFEGDVFQ
jgi:hypothetical protein